MEHYLGREFSNFYFSSDWHLAHKNILEYDERPFNTIQQHDQAIINNVNKVCEPTSLLFILGDLSMGKDINYIESLLNQIQCKMVLIKGNHDKHLKDSFLKSHFIDVRDYLELKSSKGKFILSHFPFYSWDGSHRGTPHLYGHIHKNKANLNGKHFNVGICNSQSYSPFSLEDILKVTDKQELGKYRHDV